MVLPLLKREELDNSPSRGDGMSVDDEKRWRRQYAHFIQQAGLLLELPNLTICTAVAFFQRFYARCSFVKYDAMLCTQACLFLAAKVEENGRRVRDIINTTYRLHHPSAEPLQVNQAYWDLKEEVVRFEQKLLRVLGYDMECIHPQHYVLHIVRELEASEELAKIAFYILNDSFRTSLCLQYSPSSIACAGIHLAGELTADKIGTKSLYHAVQQHTTHSNGNGSSGLISSSSTTPSSVEMDGEWWEWFGSNRLEMEDICHQLCDLYECSEYFRPTHSRPSNSHTHSNSTSTTTTSHPASQTPTHPLQASSSPTLTHTKR